VLEHVLKWIKENVIGGQSDVDGEISAAQGSCPAVGGIPLYYLPLVLGREITRRQIKDR
jgi:hypothetical protein